jgi:DNA-directed RNA polymerase subunit beta'
VVTGTNKRPLKSLSDTLKGKQGRFRQNLLGKRVDYSGRTVIVVGPDLRLHQCGLPKQMALELFKPYIYHRLEKSGLVSTVKSAKKMVEKEVPEVWDTLDEVVKEYPVMLNRAPTLHRLGIQAFEPVLVEGKALQLHPLVCTAFNADFDGDQMAVHVPLSVESQIEARVLMLASNNTLSPANGQPIIVPTQDIVLGLYYMTREVAGSKGEGSVFSSIEEVRIAYDDGAVTLHSAIKVRMNGKMVETTVGRVILWEIIPSDPVYSFRHILLRDANSATMVHQKLDGGADFGKMIIEHSTSLDKARGGLLGFLNKEEFNGVFNIAEPDLDALFGLDMDDHSQVIEMDGRYYIFQVTRIRPGVPFSMINKVLDKGASRALIDYAYRNIGPKATVILSDKLKNMGYRYSTEGGLSICIDDMIIPDTKWDIIKDSEDKVIEIARQYSEGLITQGEKYNKVVDIWAKATDDIANEMMKSMSQPSIRSQGGAVSEDIRLANKTEDTINSIFMMADSGARGSKDQMRQLAGMRGLMAKPSGEIIETPIQANFREGLSVLQYFISTHGARKGLADTALKTANSGYLTRRLADVAQDCAVVEYDCGTLMGIEVEALMEGGEVIQRLGERILGRVTLEDVYDPFTDEIIVSHGVEIDENVLEIIENAGITSIKIRSVLTCKATTGVCAKCYGRDLSHGQTVEMGQAVGILAAQSIGEPGTQLTMRTFHIGGTASRKVEVAEIKARVEGKIKYLEGLNVVQTASGDRIIMSRRGGEFAIVGEAGREREKNSVIYGARIYVADGQMVKPGDVLATWDPFTVPIITEVDGRVKFGDIEAGKTMQEKLDPVTGKSSRTIIESRLGDVRPRISIKDANNKTAVLGSGLARYPLPVDAVLLVEEFDEVKSGDILAKLPRATTKTKDITGGLPRVAELFEVRKPKETAVLSEIDGFVSISKGTKGKQKVTVNPVDVGEKKEYQIPKGRHVNVYEGDYVRAGEKLTSGSENPQDILSIKGEVALASYLVDEVQQVYRLQGVRINDKHIEVIVRQMMKRVKIIDAGDTDFIAEEQVDRQRFADVNREVVEKGGEPATGEPLVLGITKASLSTDSFISAASFQETTKVLTEASIRGKVDVLSGLKENVIMGRLIPAGSGVRMYRDIEIESEVEVSREENVTIDL